LNGDHYRVMEQPVEHRCSQHRVAGKGLIPRPEGQVRQEVWRRRARGLLYSQPGKLVVMPLDPIGPDFRKILAVDSRSALIGAALGIGMRRKCRRADLVVQASPGSISRAGMARPAGSIGLISGDQRTGTDDRQSAL
jgi:hypothetical protein